MDVCLQMLQEQITVLKENYYVLFGECKNIFDFSCYTVTPDNPTCRKGKLQKLNKNLRILYENRDIAKDFENL